MPFALCGAPMLQRHTKYRRKREWRRNEREHSESSPFSLAVFSFLGFIVSSQFHRDKPSVWVSRRSVNRAEIGPDLECVLCQARGHSGTQSGFTPPPPFHKVIIWCSDLWPLSELRTSELQHVALVDTRNMLPTAEHQKYMLWDGQAVTARGGKETQTIFLAHLLFVLSSAWVILVSGTLLSPPFAFCLKTDYNELYWHDVSLVTPILALAKH